MNCIDVNNVMKKIKSLSLTINEFNIKMENQSASVLATRIEKATQNEELVLCARSYLTAKHIVKDESSQTKYGVELLEALRKLDSAKLKEYETLCSSYNIMTEYISLLQSKCQAYDSIKHLIGRYGIEDSMEDSEPELDTQCLDNCTTFPSDSNLYGRVLNHVKDQWIDIDFKQCVDLAGVNNVRESVELAWSIWPDKNDENMNIFIEVLSTELLPNWIKDKMHFKISKSFDCFFDQLEHIVWSF